MPVLGINFRINIKVNQKQTIKESKVESPSFMNKYFNLSNGKVGNLQFSEKSIR